MKIKETLAALDRFERALWITSLAVITVAYTVTGCGGWQELCASLIGVTALIFVAKGMVAGQLLTVVFSVFYGVISYRARYYGEMMTYLGMTAPIAAAAVVTWLRHPYGDTKVVEVAPLTKKKLAVLTVLAGMVTGGSYFILRLLGNASLGISTLSVFTSFMAAGLTYLRSPYYALGYSANDIVLIILWVTAAKADERATPMILCFTMFLVNDMYGYINWRRIERAQRGGFGNS